MNKKTIITILLAFVVTAAQVQITLKTKMAYQASNSVKGYEIEK